MKAFLKKFWISLVKCRCRRISHTNCRTRTATRRYTRNTREAQPLRPQDCTLQKSFCSRYQDAGVKIAHVTLHVGLGTFRPVKVEDVTEHHMHSEFYMVDAEAAEKTNKAKEHGGRVICVGTTSCRTIESAADENGRLKPCSGWTEIFYLSGISV